MCVQKILCFWKANRILVVYDVTQNRKAVHISTITKKIILSFLLKCLFPGGQLHLSSVILESAQNLIDEVYQTNYIRNIPAVNMASAQQHLLGKADSEMQTVYY